MAAATAAEEDLLKRPLYVFDLPENLLATLSPKGGDQQSLSSPPPAPQTPSSSSSIHQDYEQPSNNATSCALCSVTSNTVADQRLHVRSDLHRFNLKRKIRGDPPVTEAEFDALIEGLSESISGSDSNDSSDSNDDQVSSLLKRKAILSNTSLSTSNHPSKNGPGKAPLIWFSSPLLPTEVSLGVYRAIFTNVEQQDGGYVSALRTKQLTGQPAEYNQHIFLCMIGGGHFAGMIVSLAPKLGQRQGSGTSERQATVLAHKTFHRYTTRRKQGGAQSANDAAKGKANSAGSSLRRYNEAALTAEIRELLESWKDMLNTANLLFIRATGTSNRRTLFGYEGAPLKSNDSRIRGFPFSTRRATQSELMRCFVELTRVKISRIDEAALAAQSTQQAEAAPSKQALKSPPPSKPSKEEEEALVHTNQLTALIRRSKAPALISYINNNKLPPDFHFQPPNHHSPTPLHLAASLNSPAIVHALLVKAGANPLEKNEDGKTPFDHAGDRATRDAFRVARGELGENKWKWDEAHVPAALTKQEAETRDKRDKEEAERQEKERRALEKQKIKDQDKDQEQNRRKKGALGGTALGGLQTGLSTREEQTRGLSAEAKARLEREQRARAAEERIRRMQQGR